LARRLTGTVRRFRRWVVGLAACACGLPYAQAGTPDQDTAAEQRAQYNADSAKTILELQQFRTTSRMPIHRTDGTAGTASLINLNPKVDAWYLLTLEWPSPDDRGEYHLQNPSPGNAEVRLAPSDTGAVSVTISNGSTCRLPFAGIGSLAEARATGLPYAPLCGATLFLRNPVAGHRTSLEKITDFLRDRVWGGDQIISFVKREFFRDEFIDTNPGAPGQTPELRPGSTQGPLAADIAPESAQLAISPARLALDLGTPGRQMLPGQWYPVPELDGISASALAPSAIAQGVLMGHERSVSPLGLQESKALVYLVAFDLAAFDLHFVMGSEHPRLDWSDRPPPASHDTRLPGPDGVGSAAPLVTNGMIGPTDTAATVSAFTGGFKRLHGAFRFGPLSERNHGSHYGFAEQGVIFSKLQPGLSTVVVMADGSVDLRTWSRNDDAQLESVRYARQNGVPLVEYDARLGRSVPGELVNLWGPGNWSGSNEEDLQTLRAGVCLQENASRRFLIYAYFSDATPSGMARVFQAYHCKYAMHLDMNALEHTYLALYVQREHRVFVEHLVQGMDAVDKNVAGTLVPRFLGFPDDRDFFYLTKRARSP